MNWNAAAALILLAFDQAAPSKFRAGVEVVRVDVLVTDGNHPVAGLTAADFELKDSGVAQRIEAAAIADVPVSMLLTLDTSTSVKGATLDRLKDAANAAVAQLGYGDRAALITFNTVVEMTAGWRDDTELVREGLGKSEARGGTSLYDAAFAALTMRDEVPGNRGLILLFTDGVDTTSWLPTEAVLEKARQTDAVVYSIGLRRNTSRSYALPLYRRSGLELLGRLVDPHVVEPFLTELADLTGGQALAADSVDRLRDAFASVVTVFRTRYLLAYTPQGVETAGWHPIEVKVKNRKGKVTARRGYTR